MMITKLFPGLIAVLVVAVLVIIVADRLDEQLVAFTKHFGG